MNDVARALDALYRLNVGVVGSGVGRHERPHKPVLLLAVFDLLDAGSATPRRVPWSRALTTAFERYFRVVRSADDDCTPENPFLYLRSDGFWEPLRAGAGGSQPLGTTPLRRDADEGMVWARFTEDWAALVGDAGVRAAMRDAIVARYFPGQRGALSALAGAEEAAVKVEEPVGGETGRSAAFRQVVVENYDHQCCACGLRIRIPELEVSFVDAAHLIPFAEARNDHPTNGVALCKHHHWAMDRGLLAPGPDLNWHVSRRVDPRRSRGEEELSRLRGAAVLVPAEPAYAPAPESLRWRLERLAG